MTRTHYRGVREVRKSAGGYAHTDMYISLVGNAIPTSSSSGEWRNGSMAQLASAYA